MKDEKIIVIEKNGEKIAFSRFSETMIIVMKILAIANLVVAVTIIFLENYFVSFFNIAISCFNWVQSLNMERNNEIFDFFANNSGGEND